MMSYVSEMRALIGHKSLLLTGATVLVFNERGELLLNLRSDTDSWGIPGGCLESGENLFTYPNGDQTESVIALYRAEGVCGELRMNDGESEQLRYFPLRQLPPLESRAAQVIRVIHSLSFD